MGWEERRGGWRAEDVASDYDAQRFSGRLDRAKHRNDARKVLALLRAVGRAPLRLLDAPVGTGRMVPDLEAAGHRVTGVDLSPAMLQAGGRGAGAGAALGEIERLPFRDDAFDAAVSLRFLFHARDVDARARMLAELARVAGALVLHERCRLTLKHRSREVRGRFGARKAPRPAPDLERLRDELARSGWRVERHVFVSRAFSDKVLVLARRAD